MHLFIQSVTNAGMAFSKEPRSGINNLKKKKTTNSIYINNKPRQKGGMINKLRGGLVLGRTPSDDKSFV